LSSKKDIGYRDSWKEENFSIIHATFPFHA
jgi:hypothetical protein